MQGQDFLRCHSSLGANATPKKINQDKNIQNQPYCIEIDTL